MTVTSDRDYLTRAHTRIYELEREIETYRTELNEAWAQVDLLKGQVDALDT
jgi:phage shock protein A